MGKSLFWRFELQASDLYTCTSKNLICVRRYWQGIGSIQQHCVLFNDFTNTLSCATKHQYVCNFTLWHLQSFCLGFSEIPTTCKRPRKVSAAEKLQQNSMFACHANEWQSALHTSTVITECNFLVNNNFFVTFWPFKNLYFHTYQSLSLYLTNSS